MIKEILSAIVLGIIEGLTEFLPISSTGHLILANELIGFSGQFAQTFEIVIQLGAILAVVICFKSKLVPTQIKRHSVENKKILDRWKKTIVGVLPALIIGAALGSWINELFFNPITISIALIIGGILLILIENRKLTSHINSIDALSYRTAFYIGLIQCLAMIPGTSRSAATIIGAMLLGASRSLAAEFSFFLAIPTIIAASFYTMYKNGMSLTLNESLFLSIGFIVSFFVAWIVIAGFMKYISNNDFKPFGYYRIVLGIVVLLYFI